MVCGYDPDQAQSTGGDTGSRSARSSHDQSGTTLVAEARPQQITDPDWVTAEPRPRLSYLGVAGVVAAILIAIGCLIFVTVVVLHRPVGAVQADAMSTRVVSVPDAAAVG
jgi:hypothetical protein